MEKGFQVDHRETSVSAGENTFSRVIPAPATEEKGNHASNRVIQTGQRSLVVLRFMGWVR